MSLNQRVKDLNFLWHDDGVIKQFPLANLKWFGCTYINSWPFSAIYFISSTTTTTTTKITMSTFNVFHSSKVVYRFQAFTQCHTMLNKTDCLHLIWWNQKYIEKTGKCNRVCRVKIFWIIIITVRTIVQFIVWSYIFRRMKVILIANEIHFCHF